MSIIGEDALTRAVSLCFPPADRLHHNNQAVLLKWNFPSVPQKGRLSCEYIRSLFKVTGCWWRLFYMSKKKLFAVDLCSVTSLSSCYLFSDVSPGSSSLRTLTLRGFLLVWEVRIQSERSDEGETPYLMKCCDSYMHRNEETIWRLFTLRE